MLDRAGQRVRKRKYWFMGTGDRVQSETEYHGERATRVNYALDGHKESRNEFLRGTEIAFFEYESGREIQRTLTAGNTHQDEDWPYEPMSCIEMFATVRKELAKGRASKGDGAPPRQTPQRSRPR